MIHMVFSSDDIIAREYRSCQIFQDRIRRSNFIPDISRAFKALVSNGCVAIGTTLGGLLKRD